jgi:O-antigen/teichoic acid export membrane protein
VSAIPLIQILSIEAIIKSLMTTAVPTYLAKGKADFGFRWNFIVAVTNSIVFYLLAGYGIIPLTLSFVGLSLIQFIILQMIMNSLIDLKLSEYADSLLRQILISIAMATLLYLTYAVISTIGLSPAQLLVILVIVGLLIYVAMNFAFNGGYMTELKKLVVKSRSS